MWFKIYYDPRDPDLPDAVVGSSVEDALAAPGRGVICLVDYEPRRTIHCKGDYYAWHPGEGVWWMLDRDGMVDNLITYPGSLIAHKQGRTLPNALFREILRRVQHENPENP